MNNANRMYKLQAHNGKAWKTIECGRDVEDLRRIAFSLGLHCVKNQEWRVVAWEVF